MKHLLQNWGIVERQIGDKKVILCLDYDGTLTPIAPTPEMAMLPEENREILHALGRNPGCSLAIVSGRALSDIKAKVGIPNLMYIGNHGLEAEGPQFSKACSWKTKG
jgi:trehalose-phosphatase